MKASKLTGLRKYEQNTGIKQVGCLKIGTANQCIENYIKEHELLMADVRRVREIEFTENDINNIYSAADLIEVAGFFYSIYPYGKNKYRADDMIFSRKLQIYKDYSTGIGGTVTGFLKKELELSYKEALAWLVIAYEITLDKLKEE